jgi:hypothetical protein
METATRRARFGRRLWGNLRERWAGGIVQLTLFVKVNDGYETVPALGESFDKARLLGRIIQCCAEAPNRGIDAMIELDNGALGPEAGLHIFPADSSPGRSSIPSSCRAWKGNEILCLLFRSSPDSNSNSNPPKRAARALARPVIPNSRLGSQV